MKDNMEPHAAVEIHDSTLDRIETSGDDVVAVIDAYVHRSTGRPGVDAGTGWAQRVELQFRRGKTSGSDVRMPMDLLDGRLILSGETLHNHFPMPLNHLGPSRIELESWNEARIVIEGDGVTGVFVGLPRYVEKFEP